MLRARGAWAGKPIDSARGAGAAPRPGPGSPAEHALLHPLVSRAARAERAFHEEQPVHLEARLEARRVDQARGPVAGHPHTAHGEMRLERLVGALEALLLERVLERAREEPHGLGALQHAHPQHARLLRGRKRAEAAERRPEAMVSAGGLAHRIARAPGARFVYSEERRV